MMKIREADLNPLMPVTRRKELVKKINEAFDIEERLDDQIKIWQFKPVKELSTKIVQDELKFLKEGKL